MKLSEAERRARSNLYRLEENTALLRRKSSLADMIREHGSRVEQRHEERIGDVSGRYIEAVPSWFIELVSVERVYFELLDAVTTVQKFTKYLQDLEPKLFELYAMKYQTKASLPDLKRRFGQKLKTLDRELIFQLIDWHSWPIAHDGGEEYREWWRKR